MFGAGRASSTTPRLKGVQGMTTLDSTSRHEIDFDHHDAEFRDDNKAVVRRLHATGCPLGHSDAHGGYWAIYGYDAVYEAVQDSELFSSQHSPEQPKGVPPASYDTPLIPIDVDGPMVHEFRRVVLSWFSPGGAKRDEQRIREICSEQIDSFIERGSCDLSEELLTALPARLILEMLGWQPERWPEWIEWVHASIHDRTDDRPKAEAAVANIFGNIATEIVARRANLGDDLFSDILRARPGGVPFTDEQLLGYSYLLLLGGMDTTAGLTGNVIELLDQRHDLRQELIDDPSLIPAATEEFLRHESPSYGLYRTVTRDAVFHGQPLAKGDRVILMFPAAGLDPSAFDNPEEISFERTSNRHMAFGLGAHRCLGSHHARVMFKVMLAEILQRLPDFRIDGKVERFKDAGDVYAIRRLPISFTPGLRSTSPGVTR
jgi:cytochrome P450